MKCTLSEKVAITSVVLASTCLLGLVFEVRSAQADVPCRNVYSQDFSWRKLNRTGRVLINNQRNSPVQITLIHPDSASKFADWTIAASNRIFLVHNNQPFYVGDDWGIQVGGGCVFYIGEVGIYNSQAYEITLSDPGKVSLSGLNSPYSPPQVSFPITGERDNSVANGSMRTSFTLNANGQLVAVTNTRTKVKMAGFTGGVSIILLNANRQPIWASSVHKYGVDGCWIGTCNRNDNWSDSVPPSILQQVRGYAILQEHTPKWLSLVGQRGEQFLRWLNSDEGKATVTTIVSIAAML